MSDPNFGGEIEKIRNVKYYTGGGKCHYQCGSPAEFVVKASDGSKTATFAGCLDCLNQATIYPIRNGWVDERDHAEQRRNA